MLYDTLFRRVLVHIEPERAHHLGAATLRATLGRPRIAATVGARTGAPELALTALGRRFASPLGVAAGLDKDATFYAPLGALGFGFVEVGTVTPLGQPGNQRPRVRRIPADRALLNAMGFPNDGAEAIAARLTARVPAGSRPGAPVLGVNLGKNRDTPLDGAADDYATLAARFAPLADYLVLNVSSPNTPGLRALETVAGLAPIIAAVRPLTAGTPLLVKISPDLADDDVDAVADLVVAEGLAGIIATNTTVDRGALSGAGAASVTDFPGGGVSGQPLRARSLDVLARLHTRLAGSDAIIVSAGGVTDAADVLARVCAGATLVQAYTAFIYRGPGWPRQVNRELADRVRARGAASIGELVGSAA